MNSYQHVHMLMMGMMNKRHNRSLSSSEPYMKYSPVPVGDIDTE